MGPNFDRNALINRAMEIVLERAADQVPGEDRAKAAIAQLREWADDRWEPKNPIGEWASDRVLDVGAVILAAVVELAYQTLRAQGRI